MKNLLQLENFLILLSEVKIPFLGSTPRITSEPIDLEISVIFF